MLEEPTPKRLFTALNANITGATSVTAEFSKALFSILTKKVSARLYATITSELNTPGIARLITALGMGACSKR